MNSQVVPKLSMSEVPSKIYANKDDEIMRICLIITYLYDGLFSFDLKYLTFSYRAITKSDIDDLCVFRKFDIVEDDERTLNIKDSSIVDSRSDVVIGGDGTEFVLKTHFLFLIL